MLAIHSIVHPTDFSDASADAFAHALRIALTAKAKLYILHVAMAPADEDWMSFPHVRETLARWGILDAGEPTAAIHSKLGVTIRKVELAPQSPVAGIQAFLDQHPADLIVLGTEGRHGAARWLHGSVAIRRRCRAMASRIIRSRSPSATVTWSKPLSKQPPTGRPI